MIQRIEALGPGRAPTTTINGFVMDSRVRNNTRSMFEDPSLAAQLFERVHPFVPASMCGGELPVGLNERWRCYRYDEGQYFAPHYDGAFVRCSVEGSRLTFILYLNDEFDGGETNFLDLGISVRPKAGQALLFQHGLLHESAPLRGGRKYAARSDVMYRRGV
jgi:predicted 2-oxoglutarate/Fe(II)-dependent dioxygenase YbiX